MRGRFLLNDVRTLERTLERCCLISTRRIVINQQEKKKGFGRRGMLRLTLFIMGFASRFQHLPCFVLLAVGRDDDAMLSPVFDM